MIKLVYVFLYVGLFTIGGGMVAIPLIQQQVVARDWISFSDFYRMVAIAESTPGPIGINIATYVGFNQYGVLGAVIATTSFILPSFLIVSTLSKLLKKHRRKQIVINWFIYVKASIVGLIGYALIHVVEYAFINNNGPTIIDLRAVSLGLVIAIIYYFVRTKPWIAIICGAILGMGFL